MKPRVSIVVPVFQNAKHLRRTLDSILAQTFKDFELVIADHSSTDGSGEILQAYSSHPRVRLLPATPSGGGAVANWNRVSIEAYGDLLKLVCADDLISPNALATQVAVMDAYPTVTLVACRREIINSQGRKLLRARGLGALEGLVDGRAALRASVRAGTNLFGEPACVMMRRKVLAEVGWWDSTDPYLIDQATYAKILTRGDAYAIREIQASFRLSNEQWSVRLARQQAAQAVAFHHRIREREPGLISQWDLNSGNVKARVMAWGRRVAYLWLKFRT